MSEAEAGLLVRSDDGLVRCAWSAGPHDDALIYHDREWGIESHDSGYIFETLALCGFAAGIRWLNVYRKRDGFRRAFHDFRAEEVAAMTDADVDALMQDASIIRNRRKIEATIGNARAALALDRPLHELVWDYTPAEQHAPQGPEDFHATSAEAKSLAKRLQAAGFAWVLTTCSSAGTAAAPASRRRSRACLRTKVRGSMRRFANCGGVSRSTAVFRPYGSSTLAAPCLRMR